jgi:hypothetical protein
LQAVVVGDYRAFFIVIVSSSATLIGLLFVAMSVAKVQARSHPQIIREFRAAAAFLAFVNPFSVSLFGLVPGANMGYPAAIVGATGLLFTAAGLRTTLSLPLQQQHRRSQLILIGALWLICGLQVLFGIQLILNKHRNGVLGTVGDVLIASLLLGIGRSWELVGAWDTGLISSVARLFGHGGEALTVTEVEASDGSTGDAATGSTESL